jgi:Zn-dependent metalloprotease
MPRHCFLPPHIHERALKAAGATTTRRGLAVDSLGVDHAIRSIRLGFGEFHRPALAFARAQRSTFGRAWWGTFAAAGPQRSIYVATGANRQRIPGDLARAEGDPAYGDKEVDEAYDGLGATFNLYSEVFQRNSIDGRGLPLVGSVHFGKKYENAFWDGQQMNFGDGDNIYNPTTQTLTPIPNAIFNRFTVSVDIMGHELTHGVTQYESNLVYIGQPGALNESLSDVFGSLVKQYMLRQTVDKADWLIGAGLMTSAVSGFPGYPVAIRSLRAPGKAYNDPALGGADPQPSKMQDYVRGFDDNFGVHINSGIPNFAFYNCAKALGGYAWERAGLIWYRACTGPFMRPMMRFQDFANLTLTTAQQIYGFGSHEADAVQTGWSAAGITV